jgi:hypothetical protein
MSELVNLFNHVFHPHPKETPQLPEIDQVVIEEVVDQIRKHWQTLDPFTHEPVEKFTTDIVFNNKPYALTFEGENRLVPKGRLFKLDIGGSHMEFYFREMMNAGNVPVSKNFTTFWQMTIERFSTRGAKGRGLGSLTFRTVDRLAGEIATANRRPIFLLTEDETKSRWSSALTEKLGFEIVPPPANRLKKMFDPYPKLLKVYLPQKPLNCGSSR